MVSSLRHRLVSCMRLLAEAMASSIASLLISIPPQLNPQLLGDLAQAALR
jgi:hypothetical protein